MDALVCDSPENGGGGSVMMNGDAPAVLRRQRGWLRVRLDVADLLLLAALLLLAPFGGGVELPRRR